MDKFISKIKELFAKLKTKKVLYVKDSINPTHDWNIFISVSLFIFVVGFIFSVYFYNQVDSGKWFSVVENKPKDNLVKINQILLDKTVLEINKKQVLRENIGKNVPADPSL